MKALALFLCIHILFIKVAPGQQPVKCYQQFCKKETNGWSCEEEGDGKEVECGDTDYFCFEGKSDAKFDRQCMNKRFYSSYTGQKNLERANQKQTFCTDKDGMQPVIYRSGGIECLCSTSMCNTQMEGPE